MGDAGALFLGLLIASLVIRLDTNPINNFATFSIPILLLAVPIMDTSVAVLSRLQRGISPFQGGKDHLSHRLIRAGLSKPAAAITLWSASLVCTLTAICVYLFPGNPASGITLIFFSVWGFALFKFLGTPSHNE